jgi:hypothetical protein
MRWWMRGNVLPNDYPGLFQFQVQVAARLCAFEQ